MQANLEIRERAKALGVKFWQIAERYGLSEGAFSRRLRHELSGADKQRIMNIIDELHNEKG